MKMYLAVCTATNTVKMFTDFEDFEAFAIKERYAYNYFKLDNIEEIPDVNLFYYR